MWRCTRNRNHEIGLRKFSFFERSHFPFADLMQFMKCFVDGESLHRMSTNTGMDYKKVSVDWASFCRELAVEYLYRYVLGRGHNPPMKLRGDVEVDESCFGSRSKYNRGQKRGMKVWIVGLVERSSNRIIIYPVDNRIIIYPVDNRIIIYPVHNRNAMTLTTIIKRHVPARVQYIFWWVVGIQWPQYAGL